MIDLSKLVIDDKGKQLTDKKKDTVGLDVEKSKENQRLGNPNWKKGISANPKGKPKGTISITAEIKRKLKQYSKIGADSKEKKKNLQIFIDTIWDKAILNKDKDMLKAIWSYIDGMPKQTIAGDSENPIEISVNSEQTKRLAEEILKRFDENDK